MERTVSNGYRDCTVLLDGTECRVTFDHCYRAFAVMNDSMEDVFVSIEQGKSSGEDGVRRIAPGCSSVIAHMRTDVDTVYVTGSGSVQISAQNGTENPFKPQSGGGDTTINGNVVTPSAVNGNIKIDGAECRVYDDTDIKEQLADIGSGVSPTVVENEDNTDELYRLDITDVNGTFTTPNLIGKAGAQGIQGAKGEKGDTGEQGLQGIQGIKGDKGDDGYPFLIYKEYSSLDEFDSAHFPEIGLMFMVKTGENFPVYRYTGDAYTPYSFVTELATSEGIKGEKGDKGDTGEQGIQGEAGKDGADGTTYIPSIGTVESAETASVSVEVDEETKQAVFNFGLPKGADGKKAVQFVPVITDDNELAWENDGGLDNPPTVPIQQIFSNAPIGTVLSYAGQTAPHGYLLCDGKSYAVADYPGLYAVIGNTYGGDSTNFNVPNLVDKFIQGSTTSGTEKEAGLPNITGEWDSDYQYSPYFEGTFTGAFARSTTKFGTKNYGAYSGTGARALLFDASLSNPIYGNSDTVQPPALTMVYIIKAFHTNEGVDSGVSDDVIEYVEGEIAEVESKIVGTMTQYRGSRSIDITTGGKLTLIYSSEYASQAGCYMLLSNYNTEPLLIELGRTNIGQFSVTATHKSENVDTITVATAGDEYSWCVLQF